MYFKSPEVLLNYPFYDYSIDIWGLGCTFASIVKENNNFQIYKRNPFFHGANSEDQLDKIAAVLGTQELFQFMEAYGIQLEKRFNVIRKKEKKEGDKANIYFFYKF